MEAKFKRMKRIPKLLFNPLPKRLFRIEPGRIEDGRKSFKEKILEKEEQLFSLRGKRRYLHFNRKVMGAYAVLTIPGKPIAKKRPRFARKGSFVITYNPQEPEEGRFLFEVQKQWKREALTNPIRLSLFFEMPIPKSTSVSKRKLMERGWIPHTKRPDLDNLIKFVKDCLNGTVYRDDSQIISLMAEKKYSYDPKTLIYVAWTEGVKDEASKD